MNIERLHTLYKTWGFNPSVYTEEELIDLSPFLSNSDVRDYLKYCLLTKTLDVSSFELLNLREVKCSTLELLPGVELCRYGYLSIAADVGGNLLCLHAPTGSVWYVNHEHFGGTGEDIKVEMKDMSSFLEEDEDFLDMPENAMVKVSDNIEEFLLALLKEEFDICQFVECVQDPLVQ